MRGDGEGKKNKTMSEMEERKLAEGGVGEGRGIGSEEKTEIMNPPPPSRSHHTYYQDGLSEKQWLFLKALGLKKPSL